MKVTAASIVLAICGITASLSAQATVQSYALNIPRQNLDSALVDLAKQTGIQIARMSDAQSGAAMVGPVTGNMSLDHALQSILAQSGLTYRAVNDHTIAVVSVTAPANATAQASATSSGPTDAGDSAKEARAAAPGQFRVAQVDQGAPASASAAGPLNASSATQTPGTLEEVVVTADKRAEREQDVPSSIIVLSGSDLESRGAVQLSDFAKEVPGLNIIGARGPGLGEIVLRGISTGSDHSSPVGLYLDDVPFTPSSPIALATNLAFDPDLADIERIEVLEGPQSTLYGANTVGGLVKYVTRQPDLNTLDGNLSVTGSDVDGGSTGVGMRGSVNLPLVADTVALRVSAYYRNDPGFVDNNYTGAKNVNWDSVRGARFSLRVKITDDLETTLTGLAQDIDQPAPNQVYLNPTTLRPAFGNLAYSSPVAQPSDSTYRSLADTTTFNTPIVKVTNVASYAKFDNVSTVDYSSSASAAGLPVGDLLNFANTSASERYSDELRLASAPGRIEWLLGGFYTYERDDNLEVDIGLNPDGSEIASTSPYHNVYDGNFVPHFREEAGFGDLTLHITDQLSVTGGARYSANSQSVSWISTGAFGANDVPSYGVSDSATTYLGTISYMPDRDTSLYLRAASAYRPGGPNVLNDVEIAGGALPSYKSDQLWNYEAGIKGSLWEHRITYTVDGYHMVWSDIQLTETINNFVVVANGSGAKSDGAEASIQLEPVNGLVVGLRAAYTDARFTSPAPALGAESGAALPYSPKTALATLIDYTFARINAFTPTAGLTYAYHGSERSGYTDGVTYAIPDYQTLDLRAGVSWDHYSLMARINNVANEYGLTSVSTGSELGNPVEGTVIQPRTFGLTLSAHF